MEGENPQPRLTMQPKVPEYIPVVLCKEQVCARSSLIDLIGAASPPIQNGCIWVFSSTLQGCRLWLPGRQFLLLYDATTILAP